MRLAGERAGFWAAPCLAVGRVLPSESLAKVSLLRGRKILLFKLFCVHVDGKQTSPSCVKIQRDVTAKLGLLFKEKSDAGASVSAAMKINGRRGADSEISARSGLFEAASPAGRVAFGGAVSGFCEQGELVFRRSLSASSLFAEGHRGFPVPTVCKNNVHFPV